uniref:G-protein coupled receptors family 1 profile domain-containing protein n=1 Tax=Calidris pygmaea TaxID=425635 RepID=A0A8C3JEC4_9CHAR
LPLLNTSGNGSGAGSPPHSPAATGLILLAALAVLLATLVGNTLVVVAVSTSRALRAPQNLFLVSLASADILVAVLVLPFSLANEVMGYWYFGGLWCSLYLALDVLLCTASIGHLCAISLDRYWAVTRAARFNLRRSPGRVKGMIGAVWAAAALVALPPLLRAQPGSRECQLSQETWYVLASCAASFFAPCLVMVAVYCRIYHLTARRTAALLAARSPCPPSKKGPEAGMPGWRHRSQHQSMLLCRRRLVRARERRFTVVLAVVMGAFVLCWFPFFFTYSLGAVCGEGCRVSKPLFSFFFWIGYCNSSLNPLIYTLFNRDFRAAFRRLLAVPRRTQTHHGPWTSVPGAGVCLQGAQQGPPITSTRCHLGHPTHPPCSVGDLLVVTTSRGSSRGRQSSQLPDDPQHPLAQGTDPMDTTGGQNPTMWWCHGHRVELGPPGLGKEMPAQPDCAGVRASSEPLKGASG